MSNARHCSKFLLLSAHLILTTTYKRNTVFRMKKRRHRNKEEICSRSFSCDLLCFPVARGKRSKCSKKNSHMVATQAPPGSRCVALFYKFKLERRNCTGKLRGYPCLKPLDLALILVSPSYCLASVLSSPLTYNILSILLLLHSCSLLLIPVLELRVVSSTSVMGHLARNQEGAPEGLSYFVPNDLFHVDFVPDVRCWI